MFAARSNGLAVTAVGIAHLKRAFSAPKICTVLAGYFARLTREPEPNTEMSILLHQLVDLPTMLDGLACNGIH